MSRIRGRNTKPEIILRKALWRAGLRYSFRTTLPGRPDIILKKYKLAIFVDGCFWHRCPKHFNQPKNNRNFWLAKINGNVRRDKKNNAQLKADGWYVFRIWEHDVKFKLPQTINRILKIVGKRKELTNMVANATAAVISKSGGRK